MQNTFVSKIQLKDIEVFLNTLNTINTVCLKGKLKAGPIKMMRVFLTGWGFFALLFICLGFWWGYFVLV